MLEQVRGSTTLILNSCLSGVWVKAAWERNLGCDRSSYISIIAKYEETGEILSFPHADGLGEGDIY